MPFQILVNLIIAVVWVALNDSWDSLTFLIGYAGGFVIIFGMRRFFPDRFYGISLYYVLKLIVTFMIEMTKCGYTVLRQITEPKMKFKSGIIKLETWLTGDWQITILACLITLTPGSVVMEVDQEKQLYYVHAMAVDEDVEEMLRMIRSFEDTIMGVTN